MQPACALGYSIDKVDFSVLLDSIQSYPSDAHIYYNKLLPET